MTTHTQHQQKKLSGEVDLKSLGALEQAKMFMEGMGVAIEESDSSSVAIANVKHTEMMAKVEALKYS